ncbi:hypothetical protein EV06_0426 [Prochlorococcus sp. MIT 0602]|nr:hypothetical protein EV06_0426 [Prochlorococcus sp. MIT 0602]KGG16941.1 hypothetical protein EV07_0368 [Prochlorococcus sp. MIT 0603]
MKGHPYLRFKEKMKIKDIQRDFIPLKYSMKFYKILTILKRILFKSFY